jgi:3-isopropylmalate/(R)-2-methylmalate dehydratase small subunit
VDDIAEGDELDVDLVTGTVHNVTRGTSHVAEPLPDFVMDIVRAGGLVPWVRNRLGVVA